MFHKTTESESHYDKLETKSIHQLLVDINTEDQKVPQIIAQILPEIEALIAQIVPKLENGGRLFYLGAGTSGRLGIVDASECPPTFGVPHEMVIGLIAGGDSAIRKAVEFAEDDHDQGWKDLQQHGVDANDVVVGIAASGTTPYVIGALEHCNKQGIITGCITCNAGSPLSGAAKYPIVAVVGPEFVTGSSRMKAGTAQKLILNMITTATMIRLGRVEGNKMVDMQLSNDKLVERGMRMIKQATAVSDEIAKEELLKHQSVRDAIKAIKNGR